MNYLGHSYFSKGDPLLLMGNLIADMVKGAARKDIPDIFMPGIKLHLAIDSFTDSDESIQLMRRDLSTAFGKYSAVLVDVFLDFLIGSDWNNLTNVPYNVHELWVYDSLIEQSKLLSPDLRKRIDSMVSHQWLRLYQDPGNLPAVIHRLSLRSSQPQYFLGAYEVYLLKYNSFFPLFHRFFKQMSRYMTTFDP